MSSGSCSTLPSMSWTLSRRPVEFVPRWWIRSRIQGLSLRVDASVGIALYPNHAETAAELLRTADVAMYEAKAGHSGFELYALARDRHSRDRLILSAELEHPVCARMRSSCTSSRRPTQSPVRSSGSRRSPMAAPDARPAAAKRVRRARRDDRSCARAHAVRPRARARLNALPGAPLALTSTSRSA